jgi:hypothetical protein
MDYQYCKGWNDHHRGKGAELTSTQVEKLDAKGEEFCAVVGPMEQPECLIVVCGKTGFVGVEWPDELGRPALEYRFALEHNHDVAPGEFRYNTDRKQPLFLETIYERRYSDDTRTATYMEICYFDRKGSVKVVRENFAEGTAETGSRELNVADLYSPFPKFGDYEEIRRKERYID